MMKEKYYKITPLEKCKTYLVHNIKSVDEPYRCWSVTQIIGSQLGFRLFENPIKKNEIDDFYIYTDPKLSGYQFEDNFDYIHDYEYWFDDNFDEEEKDFLIDQYEGGSEYGIAMAWLETGDHNWKLDGDEELRFECLIKIDLIDEDGNLLKENISPV